MTRRFFKKYPVYLMGVLCLIGLSCSSCLSSWGSGPPKEIKKGGSPTKAMATTIDQDSAMSHNKNNQGPLIQPANAAIYPHLLIFRHIMDSIQNTEFKPSKHPNKSSALIPFQNKEGLWGYLDRASLQVRIAPTYFSAKLFKNGIAQVSLPNPNAKTRLDQKLTGWIDSTGRAIFAPEFTEVFDVRVFGNKEILDGLQMVSRGDGKYGILDLYKGSWLVLPGVFEDFFFYDRTHFLADKKVFWADGKYYNVPSGCQITVVDMKNKLFYIRKGNDFRKGIVSWDGHMIVPPKYMEVSYLVDYHRYFASRFDGPITKVTLQALLGGGHINGRIITDLTNSEGKVLATFRSDFIPETALDNEGNYSLGLFSRSGTDFYFSLATGDSVEAPKLTRDAYQGFKIVRNGMKWALLDRSGNPVTGPSYTQLSFLHKGLILATKITDQNADLHGVLNIHGEVVIPFEYSQLEYIGTPDGPGPHIRVTQGGKCGIYSLDGQLIVPIIYNSAVYYRGPRSIVHKDHRYGVIDKQGQVIIPAKYKTIFSSKLRERTDASYKKSLGDTLQAQAPQKTPEYYCVENDHKRWALMDSLGQVLVPFDYGYVATQQSNLQLGWVNIQDTTRRGHGFYNIKTGVIIPPQYDIVRVTGNSILVATKLERGYNYQLLDNQGKPLSEPGYTQMDYIQDAHYFICQKDKQYGVLGPRGQVVIPLQYDYLWGEKGDLLMAQKGGAYFMIDLSGKEYRPAE